MMQDIFEHHITPRVVCFTNSRGQTEWLNAKSSHSAESSVTARTIGCGAYHSMVVLTNASVSRKDEIFACGLNNYGQLGLGRKVDSVEVMEPVTQIYGDSGQPAPFPVCCVISVCGGVHHSLALTRSVDSASGAVSQALYAWGRSDSGQLGISEVSQSAGESINLPRQVKLPSQIKTILQISCGGNHNLILTSSDASMLDKTDKIVAGSTASTDVYTWGYGDMLALGHGKEQDELVPRVCIYVIDVPTSFHVVI